jgi:hypothetical protein
MSSDDLMGLEIGGTNWSLADGARAHLRGAKLVGAENRCGFVYDMVHIRSLGWWVARL